MGKLRKLTGTERDKKLIYLGAFFVAVVVSMFLPYVINNSLGFQSLSKVLNAFSFAAGIAGALFFTSENQRKATVVFFAATGYTLLLGIGRVVIVEWSVIDALWGLLAPFVWAFVFWWFLVAFLDREFAPLWATLLLGCFIGCFASDMAHSLVHSFVEEYTWRPMHTLSYIIHYNLVVYASISISMTGALFVAHKAQSRSLAK